MKFMMNDKAILKGIKPETGRHIRTLDTGRQVKAHVNLSKPAFRSHRNVTNQ